MAKIQYSVYSSHVPAIGAALDLGKDKEPYWQKVFEGYDFSKKWIEENRPDVIFLVYNDHANNFGLDLIPTFALGTGASFEPSDEGWGKRPVPTVEGHPELAAHILLFLITMPSGSRPTSTVPSIWSDTVSMRVTMPQSAQRVWV